MKTSNLTFLDQIEHRGKLIILCLQHHPNRLCCLPLGQGPSDAEIPRDSNSPYLHNEEELDKFVFKWIIIPSSVTSLM